jgi:hypothetical protein
MDRAERAIHWFASCDDVKIRPATKADADAWLAMRVACGRMLIRTICAVA